MVSKPKDQPAARYADWIAGLLVVLIVVDLTVIGWRKGQSSAPAVGGSAAAFRFQFDPNTAAADELEYLPGLNRRLAEAIVAYREGAKRHYPDRIVFQTRQDLTAVRGISDRIAAQIGEFLVFPDERSSPAQPSEP